MEKTHLLLIILLLNGLLQAQQLGEKIFTYQKVPNFDLSSESLHRVKPISNYGVRTPKPIKNTFYEKFTFEHVGKLLYFSCKYKGNLKFSRVGIPKYVENDQPFADVTYNEYGFIPRENPVYHANGKIWKHEKVMNEQGRTAEIVYHEDGTVKRIWPAYYEKTKIKTDKEGTLERSDWCTDPNLVPYYHTQPNGETYLGYPLVGTITTLTGYSLTGFTITLEPKYGNGGVFFLENLETKQTFWATILGGHITALKPATLDEKPDIHQLEYALNATEEDWTGLNISDQLKEKMGLDKKHSSGVGQTSLNVTSKNISNFTGYGISLITSDNKSYFDHVELKVGLFKNGILEGNGVSASIDYGYGAPWQAATEILNAKWNLNSGMFKNGSFAEGRKINIPNSIYLGFDIASPLPFEGFYYKEIERKAKLSDYSMKISEVDKGLIAYLPSLERKVTIQSIDIPKGTITIFTDTPNVLATIDITKEPFYAWKRTATPYKESCNKYIKEPVYRQEDVYLYTTVGSTKSSSYTVTGVYYDKKVTTTTTTAGVPVYGKRGVLDHYKDVICYKCKGTGFIDATNVNNFYARVVR